MRIYKLGIRMGEGFLIFSLLAGVAFHQFSRFGYLSNFSFVNTSTNTQSLQGFDKFLSTVFHLSPLSIKILHLSDSQSAGKDYGNVSFVSFSKSDVQSSLNYNGPKRLDGYPDLRYNTASYGYTLRQTIKYFFEFTMKDGYKSNVILCGNEFSKATRYLTPKQLKTISFQGSNYKLSEISKAVNELNLFFQLISYANLYNKYKMAFSVYDDINKLNETIKKLNQDLEIKNKKYSNLETFTDKMTEKQLSQFKDLEEQLTTIKENIKNHRQNIIDKENSIFDIQNNLTTLINENKSEAEKKSILEIERSKIDKILT